MKKRREILENSGFDRGNGYAILVPGTDGISVSKFIGNYVFLK